ncbi:MAG: hypothetical protein ACR2MP_20380, partial [Streptosporangiaceae bacterium]
MLKLVPLVAGERSVPAGRDRVALLLGEWGHVPVWLVLAVMAATVVAVLPVGLRSLRTAPEVPENAGAAVPV